MMFFLSRRIALIAFLPVVAFSGCSFGPSALHESRSSYNVAAQKSAAQQLLLNIVRLKYREPVMFLQVSSITAHYNSSVDASGSASFPGGSPDTFGASLGAGYGESPTLSYSPLDGREFAGRILRETDINTLALLLRGGWDLKLLMRIALQKTGKLENNPAAGREQYDNFIKLVDLWSLMHRRGDWSLVRLPGKMTVVTERIPAVQVDLDAWIETCRNGYTLRRRGDGDYILLQAGPEELAMELRFVDREEANRSDRLAEVKPARKKGADGKIVETIRLMDPAEPTGKRETDRLLIQLRSFSDMLYYVAQGIEIPESHDKSGLTMTYKTPDGKKVDRRSFSKDLLDVRCSSTLPAGTFVSVYYRNRWFYIMDSDVFSKDAFTLLSLIYSLQSSENKVVPTLTIPVSN